MFTWFSSDAIVKELFLSKKKEKNLKFYLTNFHVTFLTFKPIMDVPRIMVFRPSYAEFQNFSEYVEYMEKCGAHKAGLAKVDINSINS